MAKKNATTIASPFEKHPATVAWEEFRKKHADFFDPYSLGSASPATYLENRLMRAFSAGWEAKEKHDA